ncbi:MAG: hypothetical protein LBV27_05140 [Oscillospiraceae bacterium]|jgi:NADH pyrophosphatase NudC (nudix superfamily)|nr:hypothetical protein [Oscillospiraceae bacterium]
MASVDERARVSEKQAVLLEEDLLKLEKELENKYCQLGKNVYEAADHMVSEINDTVDRLVEAKIRLRDMREQNTCLSYLAANPKHNRFCGKCGRPLEGKE